MDTARPEETPINAPEPFLDKLNSVNWQALLVVRARPWNLTPTASGKKVEMRHLVEIREMREIKEPLEQFLPANGHTLIINVAQVEDEVKWALGIG